MAAQVNMVDVPTVQGWIKRDEVVIVDVREVPEYAAQHINGAILRPLSAFTPHSLPDIPPGKKLLLHCRSANRCGTAAGILVSGGYKGEINRLAGGMLAWVAAGAPVESGPPPG